MEVTTSATLLDRVRNHSDDTAWTEFDRTYRPILIQFGRWQGLSAHDADEVAQDCLTALMEWLPSFEYQRRKGKFRGYLRRTVINKVRDRLRKRTAAGVEHLESMPDEHETPEQRFISLENQALVRRCLELIQPELRGEKTYEVFHSLVFGGGDPAKVGEEFGMTRNQVDGIKFRVLKKVREKILEMFGESEEPENKR